MKRSNRITAGAVLFLGFLGSTPLWGQTPSPQFHFRILGAENGWRVAEGRNMAGESFCAMERTAEGRTFIFRATNGAAPIEIILIRSHWRIPLNIQIPLQITSGSQSDRFISFPFRAPEDPSDAATGVVIRFTDSVDIDRMTRITDGDLPIRIEFPTGSEAAWVIDVRTFTDRLEQIYNECVDRHFRLAPRAPAPTQPFGGPPPSQPFSPPSR